jgi:hypothetical protein
MTADEYHKMLNDTSIPEYEKCMQSKEYYFIKYTTWLVDGTELTIDEATKITITERFKKLEESQFINYLKFKV